MAGDDFDYDLCEICDEEQWEWTCESCGYEMCPGCRSDSDPELCVVCKGEL